MAASMTGAKNNELIPKPSARSLANARFMVLACLCQRHLLHRDDGGGALYADLRKQHCANFLISRDYLHRRKQFVQLHLLELADKKAKQGVQ